MMGRHHPRKKQQTAKSSCSGWSRWGTRGNPAEYEGRYSHWDEGRSHDSAKDTEGDAAEGQDKNRGDAGTENGGEAAPAPKENANELVNVTDVETPHKKQRELQRLMNHRKGSLSSTNKKIAEANTKAYDLNQKTMQSLGTLAEEFLDLRGDHEENGAWDSSARGDPEHTGLRLFGTHTRRAPAQERSAGRGLGQTLSAGSPIVRSREPVQKILRSTYILAGPHPAHGRRINDFV